VFWHRARVDLLLKMKRMGRAKKAAAIANQNRPARV
jgi:hypothetical protein